MAKEINIPETPELARRRLQELAGDTSNEAVWERAAICAAFPFHLTDDDLRSENDRFSDDIKRLDAHPDAVERLKAFMRDAGQKGRPGDTFSIDEGFTAEQLAAAAEGLAEEANAQSPLGAQATLHNGEHPLRPHRIGSGREGIIKPEYRDLPDDEQVEISFRKDDGGSGYMSRSEAMIGEHHVKTENLPFEVALGMAARDPKPGYIRPIAVPEARVAMFEMALKMSQTDRFKDLPDFSPKAMTWQAETLLDADLYWVSSEMCQLLQHAAPIMPPTTLTADLMPSECGVVFFAEPLQGQDAQEAEHKMWLSAMVWGPCQFDVVTQTRQDGPGVPDIGEPPDDSLGPDPSHVVMTDAADDESFVVDHGLLATEDGRFKGNGISIAMWRCWERWLPLGRTDWPIGFDTEGEFAPPNFTPVQLASIVEDRRFAAAFAILSQQTNVTATRVVDTDRHAAKRLKRRKYRAPKIRLVDIHKPKSAPSGKTRDVEWTKRWLVRGHWRQQAYGPGRKLRRPLYIQPFIKGPEDKPLEVSPEVVKVWRR